MSLRYRPEIDGLRAIAVIAVILFHADFIFSGGEKFLRGGYLGVDVFFVISGYLITSLILKDLDAGQFSFRDFYERRARRLLPSLFTVMVISIPAAWILLFPYEMKQYAGSALSALFFGSNIWFWQENSYLAVASQLKPFLHTWSLAVEEQFYLLYPIFLIGIWRFVGRHITSTLVVVFLLSLLLAQYQSTVDPDAAFFLLPTRIWELMGGALLAQAELRKGRAGHRLLDGAMPIVGFFLIFSSFSFFDENTRHPSFLTLAPVIGTMLVIWFSNTGSLSTKILSMRPLVWIGLISYSLYLWHFTVFAFVRTYIDVPSNTDMLAGVGISLVGAATTFHAIEKPMRNRIRVPIRRFAILLTPIFLVLVAAYGYFYMSNGVPGRFPFETIVKNTTSTSPEEYRKSGQPLCDHSAPESLRKDDPFGICRKAEAAFDFSKKSYFLWGDSHIWHLYTGFTRLLPPNTPIISRSISSCLPLLDYAGTDDGKLGAICATINEEIFADLVRTKPNYVVIAAGTLSNLDELKHTIKRIKENVTSKILVVGPSPMWGKTPLALLQEEFAKTKSYPEYVTLGQGPRGPLDKDLANLARDAGIEFVSAIDVFCKDGKCQAHDGEQLYTLDYSHLWPNMSEKLTKVILETLRAD